MSRAPCSQGDDYLDPNTKQPRKIPFELKMVNDKVPIYEETLEDVGRVNEDPALPFNAFGTLALARQEFDANSGSSQIFFLLKVGLLGQGIWPCGFSHVLWHRL